MEGEDCALFFSGALVPVLEGTARRPVAHIR